MLITKRLIIYSFLSILVFNSVICDKTDDDEIIFGKDCILRDNFYNDIIFNFTGLKSDIAHVEKYDNVTIEFNICAGIDKKCNGQNVFACLRYQEGEQSVEKILGEKQDLDMINGRIQFNFTGEKCNENEYYTLHIILHCDYYDNNRTYFSLPKQSCSYTIFWPSRLACMPKPESLYNGDCSVQTDTKRINFKSLSNYNHKINLNNKDDGYFLLNLCNPIQYGYDARCPPGTSICLVDLKEDLNSRERFLNYGSLYEAPIYDKEGDVVIFKYKSDVKCEEDRYFTTEIRLTCDRDVRVEEPEYLGRPVSCLHIFYWKTKLLCDIATPCAVEKNNIKYDLSPLKGHVFHITQNTKQYIFSVCSEPNGRCPPNVGLCEISTDVSIPMGVVNENLLFNVTGAPYLIYEQGSICETGKFWKTKLEFICATKDDITDHNPIVVENKNCEVVIHVPTELVCPNNPINCKVTDNDNNVIDLTPLKNSKHNYKAKVMKNVTEHSDFGEVEYYINVCRPLVSEYGLGCSGGSSACRGTRKDNQTLENELSLGYPDASLTFFNGIPQLRYLRGSQCPDDPRSQFSSTFNFICNPISGYGIPVLYKIKNKCDYLFNWETNIICPSHQCSYNKKDCNIFNEKINKKFNLKEIEHDGKIMTNFSESKIIDLCELEEVFVVTDYEKSQIKISFNITSPCKSKYSVTNVLVDIACGEHLFHYISSNETCIESGVIQIDLETPTICSFFGIETEEKDKNVDTPTTKKSEIDDTTPNDTPSKGNVMIIISILIGVLFVAVAIGITSKRFQYCSRILSVFRKNNVAVHYSRVQSGESANLLLDQIDSVTDSDDELLI